MMLHHRMLAAAVLAFTGYVSALDDATLYPDEPCQGQPFAVNVKAGCVRLLWGLHRTINAAKVPEGVVCNFYRDLGCKAPLWMGMESPGTCRFSELEIQQKALSVLCYDDRREDEI